MVSFSDAEWTPELVELCLCNRRRIEELCLWGIGSTEWPPRMGATTVNANYPKNMNLLTTRADFQRAWSNLSNRERNLLDLYYLRGKTQEEIGRICGRHKSTICRRLELGRQKVESFLGCHATNGAKNTAKE